MSATLVCGICGAGRHRRRREVRSRRGSRRIPLTEFNRLLGTTPHLESELERDELITAIELPPVPVAARSYYRKVRGCAGEYAAAGWR